ncbi:FadR/GntR family transcriptional regulator [Bacillus marinisedimentorum]|uniref:FadR/GntR family transcriptional regulator n=1 Tax=Bacillus marinisedimentorum TaxID=1821260 RepID=UPI001FDFF77C|nr:FadR/GntR family transcriptional regulator [Bacillus marinisedimentorum]
MKITTKKISDQVADYIEQWIETGQVSPGDKLPSVRELCERFQVGRSAVRDALTTLKGKGLVDVRHGEGTFISKFDSAHLFQGLLANEQDIRELFSVRKILEAGTAELAAENSSTENRAAIKEAVNAITSSDSVSGWQADFEFHSLIAQATENKTLIQLMQTISQTMQKAMIDFHHIISSDSTLTAEAIQQHIAISEAIEQKDGAAARTAVIRHLEFVEETLSRQLAEEGN